MGRWLAVDPLHSKYPEWSPYAYCASNPLTNVDPDGEFVETALDAASVGLSAYDFYEDPSWANAGWLALDVVCAVVPFVPAVGVVRHAGKIDDAVSAVKGVIAKSDDIAKAGNNAVDITKAGRKATDAAETANDVKKSMETPWIAPKRRLYTI